MQATYTIPEQNLAEFETRVADLNKRARRLRVQEITWTTQHSHNQLQYRRDGVKGTVWYDEDKKPGSNYTPTGVVRPWLTLTVEGETPKYEGWTFIATLTPLALDNGTSENLVSTVPGHECPAQYRDRIGECDHCRAQRRRNETFVVLHDDGHHSMVGRQCLKDFLGHKDPHTLAKMAELLATLGQICEAAGDEDWGGGGGREPQTWTLEHFLRITSASIRLNGWTSAGAAYENEDLVSTKSHVLCLLIPPFGAKHEWQREVDKHQPTERDEERASKAIAWVESLKDNGEELNDYLYNLNLVARTGYVTPKSAGLAASIIISYSKAEEREIERAVRALRPNEWIGRVGDIIDLAVRIERIREISSDWGVTYLHKMADVDGRDLTWFGSSELGDVGDVVFVRAAVKKLDEYEGRKQTVITRAKEMGYKIEELTQQVATYDAKPKLTKQQRGKRDRLQGELLGMTAALEAFEGREEPVPTPA